MHTYSICFQLFPFKHRLIADKTVSFKILQLRFACLPTVFLCVQVKMVFPRTMIAAEWAGGLHLLPFQRAIVQDKTTPSTGIHRLTQPERAERRWPSAQSA